MDDLMAIASSLVQKPPPSGKPAVVEDHNCQGTGIGGHVAAAVIGAVVLAELTMGRRRVTEVIVQPQISLEVVDDNS